MSPAAATFTTGAVAVEVVDDVELGDGVDGSRPPGGGPARSPRSEPDEQEARVNAAASASTLAATRMAAGGLLRRVGKRLG